MTMCSNPAVIEDGYCSGKSPSNAHAPAEILKADVIVDEQGTGHLARNRQWADSKAKQTAYEFNRDIHQHQIMEGNP